MDNKMQNESKIKAHRSFQLLLSLIESLDDMKKCPSQDIEEWGLALTNGINKKIDALSKKQKEIEASPEYKTIQELNEITASCLRDMGIK
jgi:hypothetical protein